MKLPLPAAGGSATQLSLSPSPGENLGTADTSSDTLLGQRSPPQIEKAVISWLALKGSIKVLVESPFAMCSALGKVIHSQHLLSASYVYFFLLALFIGLLLRSIRLSSPLYR